MACSLAVASLSLVFLVSSCGRPSPEIGVATQPGHFNLLANESHLNTSQRFHSGNSLVSSQEGIIQSKDGQVTPSSFVEAARQLEEQDTLGQQLHNRAHRNVSPLEEKIDFDTMSVDATVEHKNSKPSPERHDYKNLFQAQYKASFKSVYGNANKYFLHNSHPLKLSPRRRFDELFKEKTENEAGGPLSDHNDFIETVCKYNKRLPKPLVRLKVLIWNAWMGISKNEEGNIDENAMVNQSTKECIQDASNQCTEKMLTKKCPPFLGKKDVRTKQDVKECRQQVTLTCEKARAECEGTSDVYRRKLLGKNGFKDIMYRYRGVPERMNGEQTSTKSLERAFDFHLARCWEVARLMNPWGEFPVGDGGLSGQAGETRDGNEEPGQAGKTRDWLDAPWIRMHEFAYIFILAFSFAGKPGTSDYFYEVDWLDLVNWKDNDKQTQAGVLVGGSLWTERFKREDTASTSSSRPKTREQETRSPNFYYRYQPHLVASERPQGPDESGEPQEKLTWERKYNYDLHDKLTQELAGDRTVAQYEKEIDPTPLEEDAMALNGLATVPTISESPEFDGLVRMNIPVDPTFPVPNMNAFREGDNAWWWRKRKDSMEFDVEDRLQRQRQEFSCSDALGQVKEKTGKDDDEETRRQNKCEWLKALNNVMEYQQGIEAENIGPFGPITEERFVRHFLAQNLYQFTNLADTGFFNRLRPNFAGETKRNQMAKFNDLFLKRQIINDMRWRGRLYMDAFEQWADPKERIGTRDITSREHMLKHMQADVSFIEEKKQELDRAVMDREAQQEEFERYREFLQAVWRAGETMVPFTRDTEVPCVRRRRLFKCSVKKKQMGDVISDPSFQYAAIVAQEFVWKYTRGVLGMSHANTEPKYLQSFGRDALMLVPVDLPRGLLGSFEVKDNFRPMPRYLKNEGARSAQDGLAEPNTPLGGKEFQYRVPPHLLRDTPEPYLDLAAAATESAWTGWDDYSMNAYGVSRDTDMFNAKTIAELDKEYGRHVWREFGPLWRRPRNTAIQATEDYMDKMDAKELARLQAAEDARLAKRNLDDW